MAPSNMKSSLGKPDLDFDLHQESDDVTMISASPAKESRASSHHQAPKRPDKLKDKGRFTVSPVHLPHTLLKIEEEPLLRHDSNYSTINSVTGQELANALLKASSGDAKILSRGNVTDDEGFLENYERQRLDTAVSDSGTTDTFLDEDEPALSHPKQFPDAHLEPSVITSSTVNPSDAHPECGYVNAGLAVTPCTPEPKTTETEPSSASRPETTIPCSAPVIITSHPSETSLLPPLPESVEVSRWDLNGPRNPTVQFYVGSCLSVSSAASSVSFFNTLYAHGYTPICRLCHQPATTKRPLTSPCNCVGSLRFLHHSCLMRWFNMRKKQLKHNPKCELCGYQFRAYRSWRSKENIRWPSIPLRDKILHGVFFAALALMITCTGVIASVVGKTQSVLGEVANNTARSDNTTLACGILFFIGFFSAAIAQIKANWSICKLVRLFWENNYVLQLENDLNLDPAAKRLKLVTPP